MTLGVLGDRGWHAFTVDLRGHGESEWAADGDYTLDAFAGDVLAVARSSTAPPWSAPRSGASGPHRDRRAPGETVAAALVLVDVAPRIEVATTASAPS